MPMKRSIVDDMRRQSSVSLARRFRPAAVIDMEASLTTDFSGFDESGQVGYIIDSRGRNPAALYTMHLEPKEKTLVAEHAEEGR